MEFKLQDASVEEFQWIWKNNGRFGPEKTDKIQLKDALSVSNAPVLFPKVITNIVKEAAEPYMIATSLLDRVEYSYGQTVTMGAVGALVADDIAEGEEVPEKSPQIGSGTVTATIGKSGLAVKVTEEMIKYSQFDVIGMMLRAAGRALARHKEIKIFNYIKTLGMPVFNNLEPTKSLFGVTQGRDLQGNANGSLTMDDIFDAFAQILAQGFMANTIMVHPLTWVMFVKDPQMRAFVQANGGGSFFASWTGNPAARAPWDNSNQGGLGYTSGQTIYPGQTSGGTTAPHAQTMSTLLQYPQNLNSAPVLPSYMNVPFRIIVSPFVPYDPRRKLADIYMFDSNELGVLFVDEDITTEEWNDPARGMKKIKLIERYGIGIKNDGLAIAVMKNIHVVPNEIILPAQTSIDISGNMIGKIAPNTAISL